MHQISLFRDAKRWIHEIKILYFAPKKKLNVYSKTELMTVENESPVFSSSIWNNSSESISDSGENFLLLLDSFFLD
jgi:hypothetical protein